MPRSGSAAARQSLSFLHSLPLLDALLLLGISVLSFLTLGYHPGFEDDGVYLAAVEHRVNPDLFPRDAHFFTLQLQATIFDRFMAAWIHLTHLSIGTSELLGQCAAIVGILWAARRILKHCGMGWESQWAGVAMLGAMFSLPVSGTALYILDQHLHPRALATLLILVAVVLLMEVKLLRAGLCLIAAFLFHPIMGAMGCSFCLFLLLALRGRLDWMLRAERCSTQRVAFAAAPLGWIFERPSPAWRAALQTRRYYFLYQWHWYEWLGALAPIALFWLLAQWAARQGNRMLARLAAAVVAYATVQQSVAMVLDGPEALIRWIPLQPMRYLHLVYLLLVLLAGALLGQFLLRAKPWRWAVYLAWIYGGMYGSQRAIFANTVPVEWPGAASGNAWVQAFVWIRTHTPEDAYFAVDPWYLESDGEDFHNFRALAERSVLADAVKDAAVCTQVPELADQWRQQRDAQIGLNGFSLAQMEALKAHTGANWALLSYPAHAGLDCRWHNRVLTVCRIP